MAPKKIEEGKILTLRCSCRCLIGSLEYSAAGTVAGTTFSGCLRREGRSLLQLPPAAAVALLADDASVILPHSAAHPDFVDRNGREKIPSSRKGAGVLEFRHVRKF